MQHLELAFELVRAHSSALVLRSAPAPISQQKSGRWPLHSCCGHPRINDPCVHVRCTCDVGQVLLWTSLAIGTSLIRSSRLVGLPSTPSTSVICISYGTLCDLMSESHDLLFEDEEDEARLHEANAADHNEMEHDRRTWPMSRLSSASLRDSEADFQYGVSPSLAGFLGNSRPDLKGEDAITPPASQIVPLRLSTAKSTPDADQGYLSDSHIASASRDLSSAVTRSRLRNQKPNKTMKHAIAQGTVAPGQPSKVRRAKHKFLQVDLDELDSTDDQSGSDKQPVNVTAYCAAYELDLVELHASLIERFGYGSVTPYPEGSMDKANLTADRTPDVLHARYSDLNGHVSGDIMLFEFGIVVMWGLSSGEEAEVVWQLAGPHMVQRVPEADIEVDEMHVQISHSSSRPTIEDDIITMRQALYNDVQVRVGISIALAQSTRISVQETQVMAMVESTSSLPGQLRAHGAVSMPHDKLAALIGLVFLQKTALNLQVLSGPKETPKFFWGRPDHLQRIYHAMSEYLDLDERADILNRRFSALTTMLDVLRDQQSASHDEKVEWIVILLIFITTCLGLLQIASLMLGEKVPAASE
eukprot:jgi/Ulvmu1/2733/UM014_0190.1